MESPMKHEDEKMMINEDDYTSSFFDEEQLQQLRQGSSQQSNVDMFSQQTLSNFMARGDRFDNNFDN